MISELTEDIAKCCSACFNRIARKLGTNPSTNEPLIPLVPEGSDGMIKNLYPLEFRMKLWKKSKWKCVILYVEVSIVNLIFLLIVELVETPRWTEEEMEIAKQGKATVITLWLFFLT